jgi:hypothetical protein
LPQAKRRWERSWTARKANACTPAEGSKSKELRQKNKRGKKGKKPRREARE